MRLALVVGITVFLLWLVIAAWAALVPFFLGLILAYLLLPIVNFLDEHSPRFMRRRRIARPLAIVIVYIAVIGVVAGFVSYFVPVVATQAEALSQVAPTYWRQIERLYTIDITEFLDRIPPEIREPIDANIARAGATLVDGVQKGIEVTLRTISQTLSFILGLVIIPFWLFYVLNDHAHTRRTFYALLPDAIREDVRCIVTIVDGLLGSYLRGQLLLCLIVGGMATIALILLGIDAALLLGTIAGVLELIPILGPYMGALPAVLIALVKEPILALWTALAFAAIQQIENLFLVPRISGNAVRFHPALVMVIVLMGSQLAGLWGLLVAVPVAAMIRDVYAYLYLRTTERGATPEMALETLRARTL
jgi:predicted PurR-regulated permease PerM